MQFIRDPIIYIPLNKAPLGRLKLFYSLLLIA